MGQGQYEPKEGHGGDDSREYDSHCSECTANKKEILYRLAYVQRRLLIHILTSTKDLRIVSSGNDYPTKRPISVVQASCYPDVNGQNSLVCEDL